MSTPTYQPPSWSTLPSYSYYFDVIKDGVELDPIDISLKQYYIIGRSLNNDIYLEHSSISRIHCIIQYGNKDNKENSSIYIKDCSTHGIWLNKNKILKDQYIELFIGDVIKFGESTRLYILNGPDSLKDLQFKAKKIKNKTGKILKASASIAKDEITEIDEIKEGEDIEEEINVEDLVDLRGWYLEAKNNPKYSAALLDKVDKLLIKSESLEKRLENMNRELKNITDKQSANHYEGILVERQQEVSSNLRKAEEEFDLLNEEIRDEIDSILKRGVSSHKIFNNKFVEEEDDFYDRTKKKVVTTVKGAESVESLTSKIESSKLKIQQLEFSKANLINTKDTENDDELEMFMANMNKQTRIIEISKLNAQIEGFNTEIKNAESLLKLIDRPKLIIEPIIQKSAPVFVAPAPTPVFNVLNNDTVTKKSEIATITPTEKSYSMAPPPIPVKTPKVPNIGPILPPTRINTKIQVILDTPEDMSITNVSNYEEVENFSGKSTYSNLNALLPECGKGGLVVRKSKHEEVIKDMQNKKKQKLNSVTSMSNESIETEWKPPSGQTGDGKTRLNEKFGY